MLATATLFQYLARQFLFWLGSVFLILTALFEVFDLVEMLRRASSKDIPFDVVLQLNLSKLPHLVQDVFPFIVLFGALIAFWRLAKSSELVVIRAAGISVWQILAPSLLVAFLLGVFQITVYSPFSASLRAKYEELESEYFSNGSEQLTVSKTGLWLRQTHEEGQAVIHSRKTENGGTKLTDVTVFLFDKDEKFDGRIDAKSAVLEKNQWVFNNATVSEINGRGELKERYALPTNLTEEKIQESFASADTLSFWQLPEFIKTMEEAGFSANTHRLRLHSMLSTPFLFCAMVLIAATFSIRASRRSSTAFMVLGGIMCGFLLYLMTNVVHAVGLATGLPVSLAAWMPAGVSVMLGVTALLHLEDG